MKNYPILSIWLILVILILSGCSNTIDPPSSTPEVINEQLTLYRTATATNVAATLTPITIIPVTPAPSATPFTHIVVGGETMLGIAMQYGVTLEDLQAANPEVDPRFLSVGISLTIPMGDQIPDVGLTPTPVQIDWSEPECYRVGDGGVWCFLLLENHRQLAIENLSAWIGLYNVDGEIIANQTAVGLVNILRPSTAMPLAAFFAPPLPVQFIVRGEILTAVDVAIDDDRYLDWELGAYETHISGNDNSMAIVAGSIEQPPGSEPPSLVWIVAVAYNQQGQVVGVRKMEQTGELDFEFSVYSLSGAIDRVDILLELRP